MLSYCLKCKKNTESINPKVSMHSGKRKIFSKNWITVFLLNLLLLKTQYFHTKPP